MKYIFITGGVVSGLGKGITAASLGRLLINRGFKVTIQKLDAYINIDTRLMSPLEHGEIFVTEDGTECDVDVGHYERFLGRNFARNNNWTMGKIYSNVIARERKGGYHGKNIQVIPQVTNEIKSVMRSVAEDNDIVIVEVGGTVGDIEQMAYIEAIRQFRKELGEGNSLSIHVTLVPYLKCSKEIKTKPTQNSVRDLAQFGVFADFVICRTDEHVKLDLATREKIAMFCSLDGPQCVIHNRDCASIYEVPILLSEQEFDNSILEKLGLVAFSDNLSEWRDMVSRMYAPKDREITVAIVGKYVATPDAYYSIGEAVRHACLECNVGVTVKYFDPKDKSEKVDLKILADKKPYTDKKPRAPQFSSRPYAPHPHFVDLIKSVLN